MEQTDASASSTAADAASRRSASLYVKNLPRSAERDQVKELFAPFGEVRRVEFTPGRGFAFVSFAAPDSVDAALAHAAGFALGGETLVVEPRKSRERRSRGGRRTRGKDGAAGAGSAAAPAAAAPAAADLSREVAVLNLPESATTEEISAIMSAFGEVTSVRNRSKRRHAFITYATADGAVQASAATGLKLGDADLVVEPRRAPPKRAKAAAAAPTRGVPASFKTSVYVAGLTEAVDSAALRDAFGGFGTVRSIRRRKHSPFAFVTFTTEESAAQAAQSGSVTINDVTATVELRKAKEPTNEGAAAAGGSEGDAGADAGGEGDGKKKRSRRGRRSKRGGAGRGAGAGAGAGAEADGEGTDEDGRAPQPAGSTLYVNNLPVSVTNGQLRDVFTPFGKVKLVVINRSRAFCFVDFSTQAALQAALAQAEVKLFDKPLRVAARTSLREGESEDSATPSLYVTNFDDTATEEDFRTLFGTFGVIKDVTLYPAKAHAFLDFASPEVVDAARAAHDLDMGAGPVGMEVARTSARAQLARIRRRRRGSDGDMDQEAEE
eukprot:CAMPEP_0196780440 /NCGR_PEP_ID=MMETSP1104-20130614/7888_1 /TAXON_ID=33652 /ORGANISM="Cafeteria sp., Strain Caron Lab Isolate" /LENGTH=550 /DNA_ID=CAMNT_0042150641 /DNA_START=122 /DNA_END=1774 /DNA_ORIENTATION=+